MESVMTNFFDPQGAYVRVEVGGNACGYAD